MSINLNSTEHHHIMTYPLFYDNVEKITLYDPLAELLGSFENGIITFSYLQSVQTAGHSCPTVGGAYLMTLKALQTLYTETLPVRGEIRVSFKEPMENGVAGVIGNVISNITGATDKSGFKGLGGKFARHSLMNFNAHINSSVRFTRTDTGKSVDVFYNPSYVQPHHNMQPLLQKIMQNMATDEEKKEFGSLWQARVEKILINYKDYPNLIKVTSL